MRVTCLKSPRSTCLGWALLGLLAVGIGCGEAPPESEVLARVDGQAITDADLERHLEMQPALARVARQSALGRSRALEQMIEEEILYRAAVEEGLDQDEEIRRKVANYERQLLLQTFLDDRQAKLSVVTEEEALAFYEEHREEYRTEPLARVRMLLNPQRHICARAKEMVEEGVLDFPTVCGRFSEADQLIRVRGLLPSWVRKDRAIPWFGNHQAFHDVVFSIPVNEISEPFEIAQGYVILRVEEREESRVRTFEEVRHDVEGRIVRARSARGLPELMTELKERYRVEVREGEIRSAEELFTQAQGAANARERVLLYEELVRRYPNDERSVESWFMIGFIRSEELRDKDGAREAFHKVIELAPDSELAQSAQWMLTSSEQEAPRFDDAPASGVEGSP